MAKKRMKFTFPPKLITEPVIYNLGHRFKIVTNIRRAEVSESRGWVVLEMEGDSAEIERGIAWVTTMGVRADPIEGDVVAG
ncbi:MAG: NIL domain-containing protein [Chloroflexi bacterium]|nr:NIL domain-containing protein [Chloroflexota bacterium]